MDKSAIDTPSREIDLRNIPVHLRTALRRALEFEARAPAPRSAEEAEQCEEQLRAIADEFFGALLTPVLQRAVRSAAVGDAASALVRHLPRRMRSDGLETVNVRTSRGTTVPVTTPYYREKHARRAKRRPGLYPALVVLGIYDRCTPKLASDASRAVAMLSSLAEAQAQLRSEGIALDIKTLRSTAYRYAARARAAQQSAACGLLDRVTGKRVVVSLDGGRVRVRRKKRGPKTKKGRNRFHTDWKEPKLLILYVVGDDGRPSQTWAPIIDGTLRGPEAVFALLLSYARQIGLNAADKVLFIADGAPWIWQRIQRLIAALGLSPTQVLGLIDFYHAAKQLSDAVKLRRWSATQRTRWLNRTRGLLKRARVDEVITALRELCRGRTAGKIRTHLNYFLKNRHRFAYTTMVGLGLPQGSGAVESAIRRVINLRIKGASMGPSGGTESLHFIHDERSARTPGNSTGCLDDPRTGARVEILGIDDQAPHPRPRFSNPSPERYRQADAVREIRGPALPGRRRAGEVEAQVIEAEPLGVAGAVPALADRRQPVERAAGARLRGQPA